MLVKDTYPYYLAGEPRFDNTDLEVTNKYTGEVAAKVALADGSTIFEAIGRAAAAEKAMATLPPFERAAILKHAVARFEERHEELARALCIEAGKPIRDSRGEVTRLIDTFRIASEEATRISGSYEILEISPRARGYQSVSKRVPIGPCSFISPFNFPLNLVAHKVAPAIAVGCPFVLKPASLTPIGALIIGEILAETSLPKGAFSILPAHREGARLFTEDERLKLLSFTGSPEVGWALKSRAGRKKVVLELGGNAACIVDQGTDLEYAAERIIFGAFYQSGQSCISVQRVYVHQSIWEEMVSLLIEKTAALKAGDPLDEETYLGPIISQKEAARIEEWIDEATSNGAKLLTGGGRQGSFVDATWLTDVSEKDRVSRLEVFGPVAILEPFKDFKEAIAAVNRSDFGLQAGVFTQNINRAFYAWNELEVGGVIINDIPSMRVDSMPYGGVKQSGLGREGVRFAMEEMTELRLLVLNRIGDL